MKQIAVAIVLISFVVSLVVVAFTLNQVEQERINLISDLEHRTTLLGDSFAETVEAYLNNNSANYLQKVVEKYSNRERLAGLAVYDNKENLLAMSIHLPADDAKFQKLVADSMDADKPKSAFIKFENQNMYVLALPLHERESVVGALTVVQNAGYIDTQLTEIWRSNLIRLFIQVLILSVAILFLLRWIIWAPVSQLVEAIKSMRSGKTTQGASGLPNFFLLKPLVTEVSNIGKSLHEARLSASEEARLRFEKLDTPWTAQRLQELIKVILKDKKLLVVSNREPYAHYKKGDQITVMRPVGGVVTAIEPIMQACSGTWIAHGSGTADREVVDKFDKIGVPPEEPKYSLKRVWLTQEEEDGYYYGFSNEGLWPLCHISHARPIFRKEDWDMYQHVNGKFTSTILEEIKSVTRPIILIQDYHFALLPKMIRDSRPDALIAMFWHIPWPNSEAFRICPWRNQILEGLLGADLIGFHIQLHCNNFIDTVARELESLIDYEQFAVRREGHVTYVKPFPISIAYTNTSLHTPQSTAYFKQKITKIQREHKLEGKLIGLGVDRMDYTKGILERLTAVDIFLAKNPKMKEKFTFVQIAAPSRTRIKKYKEFSDDVIKKTVEINKKYQTRDWKPILLLHEHHERDEILPFYEMAHVCMVTSLHDGMNLVAKEFISARSDEKGVLILSEFTGASRELKDALIVNPYNAEQMADAIYTGLTMSQAEQTKRMRKMRETIKNYNIYRWSAELLKTMAALE